ncbi:MAG: amino acid ABC transporter substrate-binding protein [Magnetococcales bacterium]|nr:amino acid ABC transporter substrate-binding protein [Magnetococcales bacterium]
MAEKPPQEATTTQKGSDKATEKAGQAEPTRGGQGGPEGGVAADKEKSNKGGIEPGVTGKAGDAPGAAVAGTTAEASDQFPEIGRIARRGRLVVGMVAQDQPPFFMKSQGGELIGFDVSLAQGIARQLKVGVTFNREATTFNGVVDLVASGKVDIGISKLSRTLDRARRVLFSRPYAVLRQGMLLNRLKLTRSAQGRHTAEVLGDFSGEIGVVRGSSYEGFAREKFPHATVIPFPDWEAIIAAVLRGDILAAYRDEVEIKKIIRGMPEASLHLQTVVFKDAVDPIVVALPQTSTGFREWINIYFDAIKLNATAETILDKYSEIFSVENESKE